MFQNSSRCVAQLHRIAAAHATKWYEGNWTTTAGSYNTSYGYDKNGNIQYLYRNDRDAVTIDDLEYHYDPIKKNRLDIVKDGGTAEGLNNANPYEYNYDNIGNLIKNEEDGIEDIEWNIYGKVEQVTKTDGTEISYRYDGTGNRIMKKITAGATRTTTTYLRDASGNVMAIYEEKTDQTLVIKEIPIYGSSRLGQYRPKTDAKKTALGQRIYEFSNHLGNVLVTLTDNKVPQTDGTYSSVVLSASDYYPFGMAMAERTYSNSEYRYGFNGQEQSDELNPDGNSYTAEFWQYDAKIGRRWNVDPVEKIHESSYASFANNPINFIDPNGADTLKIKGKDGGVVTFIHEKIEARTINVDADIEDMTFDFTKEDNTSTGSGIPDAFGYTISATLGGSASKFAASGQIGLNYVIFTRGDYAWQPVEYVMAGGQIGGALQTGLLGGEITIDFSPFVAWNNVKDSKIVPESWAGEFSDISFNFNVSWGYAGGASVGGFSSPSFLVDGSGWYGASFGVSFGFGAKGGAPVAASIKGGGSYYWLTTPNIPKTADINKSYYQKMRLLFRWADMGTFGLAKIITIPAIIPLQIYDLTNTTKNEQKSPEE